MRDIYIFVLFASTLPAIFFQPHIGVLVWAWISYMNPHRLTWGFAYDFRFALICAGATIVAWVVSREPVKLPRRPITLLLATLLIWIQVTTLLALAPNAARNDWDTLTKVLVMTLVTLGLLQSRERIHAFVWLITTSIGFYAIKGALWFVTGGLEVGGRVWGPPASFIAGNNELALAIAMIIPLMLYLRAQSEILWIRLGFAVAALLSVVAIIGSFSRGAVLALAATGSMLVLRSRYRFRIGALVLVSVLIVGAIAPERWYDRLNTITEYEEDRSAIGRLQLWEFAWNLALERPIVGGGFRAFADPNTFARLAPAGSKPRAYHNIYFQMLGDHGFIGLGIFLLLFLAAHLSIARAKKLSRGRPALSWVNDLARMIEVSLITFAVGGMFYSLAIFDLFYHLVILALLTQIIAEREANDREKIPFALIRRNIYGSGFNRLYDGARVRDQQHLCFRRIRAQSSR